MAQIRPIKFTDSLNRPVNDGTVWIYEFGKAYDDPLALLPLTDAKTGNQTSNPFRTNSDGFAVNQDGERINPTTSATRWGLRGVNSSGVLVYDLPAQWSDTFAAGGESSPVVDASFNNFEDASSGAKAQNLADFNFIFIRSQGGAGWENTVDGPVNSFYAHATGGPVGDPSTGTPELFYDSQGKEWAMSDISTAPYVDLPADIQANADAIAALPASLKGYIFGLRTSSSDGSTVAIEEGSCSDSTGTIIFNLAAGAGNIQSRIDAGGNLSGDDSPLASTRYYTFLVSEADGSNIKIAFDVDVNAANALSEWTAETGNDYTLYREIGILITSQLSTIYSFTYNPKTLRLSGADGNKGFNVYRDSGRVEQWGRGQPITSGANVSLLIEMPSTNYILTASYDSGSGNFAAIIIGSKQTGLFNVTTANPTSINWYAISVDF